MKMSSDVRMPFGKYNNKKLMNIPRLYLEYLLEQEWFEEKFPELQIKVKEQLERRDRSYDTY